MALREARQSVPAPQLQLAERDSHFLRLSLESEDEGFVGSIGDVGGRDGEDGDAEDVFGDGTKDGEDDDNESDHDDGDAEERAEDLELFAAPDRLFRVRSSWKTQVSRRSAVRRERDKDRRAHV